MRLLHISSALLLTFLTACASKDPVPLSHEELAAASMDAHGCNRTAGLAWCSSTNQCENPWELSREEEFQNTPEAFDKYCQNPVK